MSVTLVMIAGTLVMCPIVGRIVDTPRVKPARRGLAGGSRVLLLFLVAAAAERRHPVVLRHLSRAAGLGVMLWGARCFAVARTTIKPFERSRALVESGPYRFTRNPMYLGMASMLTGLALALGTTAPWLAPAALPLTLERRFIRHEERALRASLGAVYERYCQRVRRWL